MSDEYYNPTPENIALLMEHKENLRHVIKELRAENARLLAALKPFADKAELYSEWAGTARDAVWFPISDLRAARAAMGESDE